MAVEHRVKKIIAERLGGSAGDVKLRANLIIDLGADSIDLMEIGMELEDKFDVDISFEDAEKLVRVEDIVNYIEKY